MPLVVHRAFCRQGTKRRYHKLTFCRQEKLKGLGSTAHLLDVQSKQAPLVPTNDDGRGLDARLHISCFPSVSLNTHEVGVQVSSAVTTLHPGLCKRDSARKYNTARKFEVR